MSAIAAAAWLLFKGWIVAAWQFVVGLTKWFFSLPPVVQVAAVLIISLVANAMLLMRNSTMKNDHKTQVAAIHASYVKKEAAQETVAIQIHESRSNVWDVFVANAKIESDKRDSQIWKDLQKTQAQYAKLKAQYPLPVGCKFDPAVVRYANKALWNINY